MNGKSFLWLAAAAVVVWFFFFRSETIEHDRYQAALAAARDNGKLVLLDFTGSDWCGWCVELEEQTFSKPEYQTYARENLETVVVDFPRKKPLAPEEGDQNSRLAGHFAVEGFPTLVLVDSDGKELARHAGFLRGGPRAFIEWVEGAR
jgi:protein disulfide-isomerase